MKYNDNGEYKDIYVKAFDTLPVGAEVDYDGSVVPSGWTEITDPNTYSTDEVRIGTWIDGKPIYRKVIAGTFPSANTMGNPKYYTSIGSLPNINKIITFRGVFRDTIEFSASLFGTGNYMVTYLENDSATIVTNFVITTTDKYTIILEYTKTTD